MRALRSRKKSGAIAIVVAVALTGMAGAGAFVIDLGNQRVVGAQLQAALDAASLAGAARLSQGPAAVRAAATTVAGLNTAGGAAVALASGDVQIGTWDSGSATFTLLSGSAEAGGNAVRVRLTHPDIPTFLGDVFGVDALSVTRSSTAGAVGSQAVVCGILVSTLATLDGYWSIDSYTSAVAPYDRRNFGRAGSVCSNASITATGMAKVYGSLRYGRDTGDRATVSSSVTVTGEVRALDAEKVMPSANSAAASRSNNNSRIPRTSSGRSVWDGTKFSVTGSDTVTLSAGTYYCTNFTVDNSARVYVTGPVTIYVKGDFHANGGGIVNTGANPADLTVYVDGSWSVEVNGAADFYGSIIAPNSEAHLNGAADEYGVLVARRAELNGSGRMHADTTLVDHFVGTSGGNQRVVLVR